MGYLNQIVPRFGSESTFKDEWKKHWVRRVQGVDFGGADGEAPRSDDTRLLASVRTLREEASLVS